MRTILVGTDFSTRSDRALLRAVSLARQTGSELLIVTVIESNASGGSWPEAQRSATTILRQTQAAITEREGLACRFEVRSGDPARELAKAAEDAGAKLMVIGPDRRRLIRDAFGAVTAERIVRVAPVPLIVAKADPWTAYQQILVPVELAEISQVALRDLRALDLTQGATISLLHVYDPEAREMLGRSMIQAPERRRYLDECAATANAELREFARSAAMDEALLIVEEVGGPVSATVARVAAETSADLIVVSPNRKGFFGRQLLGSTTENLLRTSRVDLLVLSEPDV